MTLEYIRKLAEQHKVLFPTGHFDAVVGVALIDGAMVAVIDSDMVIDRLVAAGLTP